MTLTGAGRFGSLQGSGGYIISQSGAGGREGKQQSCG